MLVTQQPGSGYDGGHQRHRPLLPDGGVLRPGARFLGGFGGRIVHAPREDDWAPGYYSVLFEDPCGTRLEVNYVPGKGNLDEAVSLPLPADMQARLSVP